MKHIKLLGSAFFLLGTITLLGFVNLDDDIIKKIADQLGKWANDNPQEKVYLHMDKPYYAIGDDIWFKAYVTIGSKHQLSALSTIVNVELINDKDSIAKTIKLPLSSGTAYGDFKLTDSLKEGNYRVRAYTNWMRNAGEEYFFDKTIQIGNAINNELFTKVNYTYSTQNGQQKIDAVINYADINGKPYIGKEVTYAVQLDLRSITKGKAITNDQGNINLSFINNVPTLFKSGQISTTIKIAPKQAITKILPVKAASNKIDVQFFPEGGTLVAGIRTKVAFKAVGADGLGVEMKGVVYNDQNQAVAKITTQHLGMGYFMLLPEAGKTYTAKVTYQDGTEKSLELPKVTDKGYVLNINNSDPDNVLVKISASEATFHENQNSEINLVAQASGFICYASKSKLSTSVFSARIPRSRFPSGIVQFTIFSGSGEPLNERIIFIQNNDLLNLSLASDKTVYAPREKVKLNVTAKNSDAQPVIGSFSVAVIDESKVPVDENNESTIISNILLSSDIKGYIEKPNYYFNTVTTQTQADLDVLMLTQGYRRFEWKQIINNNITPFTFQPEKSLNISGHLKTLWGSPVAKGKVTLFTTSGGLFLIDTVTDDKGNFTFKNLVFTDSVRFVIQARTGKNRKNVEIDLDNIPAQLVTRNKNSADIEINVNSTLSSYLQNSKKQYDDFVKYGIITKSTMLQVVNITDKRLPLKHSDNLNGSGSADQVIKSTDLQSCSTLESCLQGRLFGVIFRGGIPYSTRSINTPMGLVVDGINLEPDFLSSIEPSEIESIEVLRTIGYTAIYGSRGSGGMLVITTKRGEPNYSYKRYSPGIITYNPIGYYRARQFYSPQYDDIKTNSQVLDLRTTIFWKPSIVTNNEGVAAVEFFNADSEGTYRAVIEGIDGNGNIGRHIYRYTVKKPI